MKDLLLNIKNLKKYYISSPWWGKKTVVRALDGVSLKLFENETVAVVGESGCGKSTLAKVVMQLEDKTEGEVLFKDQAVENIEKRDFVKNVQMIFQDPYGSLNPRKRVRDLIAEPLVINEKSSEAEVDERVDDLMLKVGLQPQDKSKFPHMLSGGQRQRIGIARALILRPRVVICDEPVSALDLSIQSQVLNLLMQLQDEEQLSYLFISHDLAIVKHISHRVIVMYFGKTVEMGAREEIFERPLHPYTQALLASVPSLQLREEKALEGEIPSSDATLSGCAFAARCPLASEQCFEEEPSLMVKSGRSVACHNV